MRTFVNLTYKGRVIDAFPLTIHLQAHKTIPIVIQLDRTIAKLVRFEIQTKLTPTKN